MPRFAKKSSKKAGLSPDTQIFSVPVQQLPLVAATHWNERGMLHFSKRCIHRRKEIAPSMQKARDVPLAAGLRDEQIATKG